MQNFIPEYEFNFVTETYRKIADHFSETRPFKWDWIESYLKEIEKDGGKLLDIGCGNGRNINGLKNLQSYGVDTCKEFIEICLKRGLNVKEGSMCDISFRENYFDHLICIAAFHHLATKERRLKALQEMSRILKPGGTMLVSVWSKEQPSSSKKNFEDYGDNFVSWNKYGVTHTRYYYIFKKTELEDLFSETSWKIKSYFWNYGNHIYILQR